MILSKEYLERYKKLELLQIISDAMELDNNDFKGIRFNLVIASLHVKTLRKHPDSVYNIIKHVGKFYGLEVNWHFNKTQKREYVQARQQAIVFIKSLGFSNYKTGLFFKKDHATVNHSRKMVSNLFETNKEYRMEFETLCRLLNIDSKAVKYLNENID